MKQTEPMISFVLVSLFLWCDSCFDKRTPFGLSLILLLTFGLLIVCIHLLHIWLVYLFINFFSVLLFLFSCHLSLLCLIRLANNHFYFLFDRLSGCFLPVLLCLVIYCFTVVLADFDMFLICHIDVFLKCFTLFFLWLFGTDFDISNAVV